MLGFRLIFDIELVMDYFRQRFFFLLTCAVLLVLPLGAAGTLRVVLRIFRNVRRPDVAMKPQTTDTVFPWIPGYVSTR